MSRSAIAALFLLLVASPLAAQDAAVTILDRYGRISDLPRFKTGVEVGNVSSYDRSGGNDDGFNGTYSFVRKIPGGLVIADLKGPGAVTRIWTPTPSDDIVEFYFDGEERPRISEKFADLFSGKRAPFLAPLSVIGAGGFTTYAPLPYASSLRIVVRTERFHFYQVSTESYRDGREVRSFRPGDTTYEQALARASSLLGQSGGTLNASTLAPGDAVQWHRSGGTLAGGARQVLFQSNRGGRIVALKLGPAGAFAGPARDILLNVYYDDAPRPAISLPAGDLFGYAWGQPAMRSLLAGTAGETNYLFLPMPFDRSVRVELASERRDPVSWRAEVALSNRARSPDEGKLYAIWRRENPTTRGRPFTLADTRGRGHLVGVILQAQGTRPGVVPEYFEGDDRTVIDGRVAIRGTGSEDFFNGGWYDVPGRWDDRVSLPLSGSLGYDRPAGRTGGYRFLIGDPYPFTRSLLQTIEHGPTGNAIDADYSAVTLLYSDRPPVGAGAIPALSERAVAIPPELVFTPGWTTPVAAFSWKDSTLAKTDEKIGSENIRHLQFRATGGDVFGSHYIAFLLNVPADGVYDVAVQAIAGPTQGRVQLFEQEVAVGPVVDLYAVQRAVTPEHAMGQLNLSAGDNRVMFKLVGKDDRSSGFGFDVYRIILRKRG